MSLTWFTEDVACNACVQNDRTYGSHEDLLLLISSVPLPSPAHVYNEHKASFTTFYTLFVFASNTIICVTVFAKFRTDIRVT